ncbi:MAG TPA: MBL fold metallo-hydrolase [Actinomycetota bacterium]|nr:MBL fold metallo-hydrolase [Actinomycetota bacterium]
MHFKQFYLESLGHASYLVADEGTGEALVLDPRRDVDAYFEEGRRHGLRIRYAIDTHGHNDYVTGISEIARRQDVELLGYEGAPLGYPHRGVSDGEIVELGDVAFEVLHTPGHTPEHVSLLVYDRAAGDEPTLLLSGGALLVGDLARPDLLGGPEEARRAATAFCHTIQEKILWRLPDHVEVWPTHVAGSLCGGNIGSRLSTTVGYERKTNAVLARVSSSEEFVEECIRLDNLPAVPPYWRRMRAGNLAGPELLGVLREPLALKPDRFEKVATDAVVLDVRSPEAFAGDHVPGALNVELGSAFPTWAGTVTPPDAPVLLVLDAPGQLWEVVWQMLRIGYNPPVGWLAGGMRAWATSGRASERLGEVSAPDLHRLLAAGEVELLDVRQPAEWAAGHVEGATFVTGAEVPSRPEAVPAGGRPLVVMCGTGFRSSVIASWLQARGRADVLNLVGGMSGWRAAGLPTAGSTI